MATKRLEDDLRQLATRVPARLLRAVKVHCVGQHVTMMEFVTEALREKLRRAQARRA